MSSLVQLTIQGIRSFGIKAEDKQSITFSAPVTLILGANGCGKTTIIECLKYALTGELPPGCDRGKGFVHDPKIFDAIECLGQVKLKVKNIHGQYLTVTKSVQSSYKGKNGAQFKALDTTVTTGENESESISKRGADVQSEVIRFMGVSSAIINNVIFCHQENSSWPLDESKKLKEKFDAIFGTTKYDKAIDKMIKMKKEQEDIRKLKQNDLNYAAIRKKETDSKTLDLEYAKQKKENLKLSCEKLNDELQPIEDRLVTINKIEMEISKYHAKKIKMQSELKMCNEQITSLKSKVKKEFQGSLPQLDREIRNFHEKMEEKKTELQNVEEFFQSIKLQERKLEGTLKELEGKRVTLTHKRQREQELLAERSDKIMELCRNFGISVPMDIEGCSESIILGILGKIKEAFSAEHKNMAEMEAKHDKEDNGMQMQIDKCRENKVTIESDLESKRILKSKQEQEKSKIEIEIKTNEKNAKKLSALVEQIEKVDRLIKQIEEKVNLTEKKKAIESKKLDVKQKDETFRNLDQKLTFLNSISKIVAEIGAKEKEIEKRRQDITKVRSKHGDNMKKIFPGQVIESNYKRKVDGKYEELKKKIKDLQESENANRLKLKGIEIDRKNKKEELTKWEREFEENSEKIFEKCRGTSYDEVLARCKESVEKLQLELGALRSSESMFKKYIKKIQEDPHCPLCHKHMSNDLATDVTTEMADEIRRVPANIETMEQSLKKEQKNYEDLMGLKSIIEKNRKLENDIPAIKENLKKIQDRLVDLTNQIENSQILIAEPNSDLNLVISMSGDMALIDDAIKDVQRAESDLKKLKDKLPKNLENTSIDDVQLQKLTISAELDCAREELEKMQTEYDDEMSYLNKEKEKRISLKDTQNKLQEGLQSLPQLKIRVKEISDNIATLSKEIEKLEHDIEPLKVKLKTLIDEKEMLKNKNRKVLDEAKAKLENENKINDDVERYNKELKELANQNLVKEIENLKKTYQRVMDEQKSKREENCKATEQIETLKNEISNQELLERDLKDNRELKDLQQRELSLKNNYEDLNREIGELNFENVTKERANLITKRDAISVRRGQILGQTGEIEIQINKLENELKDPKYKDSLKNYRKLLYEVEILNQVIHDLAEYNMALHKALIKYHSEKMQKINRLIREFWRQIYRGNDIDYIEIKTDNEDNKTSTSSTRRTFNYSVVQSKNRSKIEMRGRCSAGQRVLASLIIRMALAETFSSNCGVLALDEPTTNLDRNNIVSLCETLNRIIEERRTQCNFMLIIITHDEEFISSLGKIRNYHKVSRSSEGKSVIRKVMVA